MWWLCPPRPPRTGLRWAGEKKTGRKGRSKVIDTLIANARLWTGGPLQDIHIVGSKIVTVLPVAHDPRHRENARHVIELDGRLVFPGLVNAHAHLDKAMLAGHFDNESGTIDEVRLNMKAAKKFFTHDDVYDRASRALQRCTDHGVTAVRTHVDIDPTVGLTGLRALVQLREELRGRVDLQIVAFPQEGIEEFPGTYELLVDALEAGADLIGGHPSVSATTPDLRRQVDIVFELAKRFDVDIDLHTDFGITRDYTLEVSRHEDGNEYPDNLGAVYIADKTVVEGYQGRVTASHLCGLDMVTPDLRANVCALLRNSGVAVVSTPPSNLYGNGRDDATGTRRGITRVRELDETGVLVAVGTDNIRDAFDPFGNTDLIQNAVISALACHLVTEKDFLRMLWMHTGAPAQIMGLKGYGLAPGDDATLVALEARSLADLLDGDTARRLVLKCGRSVGAPALAPLQEYFAYGESRVTQ